MGTSKRTYKEIFFVIVFIVIDAFCIFQYTDRLPLILPLAILLSILVAAVLDIFSFVASFYGAGPWLKIPDVNLPEIKTDRKIAIIITILAVAFAVLFQVFLVIFRYNQIIEKTGEYNSRTELYYETINENDFSSERTKQMFIQDRPEYDGNIVMDWISIIVPVATTILSFIIGMVSVKDYDKFEKIAEKKQGELLLKQEELLKKQTELDKFYGQADSKIKDIQSAGEIPNLKELLLSDISGENREALGNFAMRLESNLRNGAPKLYAKHNENLIASLLTKAGKIKMELSRNANDPSIIMGIDLERDFENEINQLRTLENILDKKN